ncbi:chaperone protein DNAK, putative [Entamoeba dispar SAW760]|uniref:Chaperone protein DNAK, putative n=1 Tax=Entamoeba dispar (strain ATCC PRA-260 / SAW760) TaxID=370354 RepID=B0ETC2_ENTDS|nr:chaperone protein DNAK, putative [Entamoeba dispar SAW760]EDR22223.1 chaperone protein DNAK, putative [Entamoeba dispar SAW760]|eukprot:EDR22223.1 chaperone protein DNAK, putative [Entamoeba dispar SAW760]
MAVEENSFSIGIDLGTTFSSVAYYDPVKGEPVVLQDETGKEQVASWISISQLATSGFAVVGNVARYDIHSECIIYDSKRIIGRDESDVSYDDREHWPFEVKGKDNGSAYIECYNPKTQESEEFEPEEISGMILRYLYENAQAKLGNHPISNVVVTVPVDFNDRQRNATLLACKLAGIKNVELANEPTAAIAGYKRVKEYPNSLKNGDKVVVIDFGGGTLDVSCCKIVNDNIIVESSGGNQNLGGNNFDNVMIDIIKERIEESIPGYYEKKQGMTQKEKIALNKKLVKLKKESEKIKIVLSGKTETELDLETLLSNDYDDEYDIDPTIKREEFEKECENRGLYEEFINKIKQVTQKKGYKKGNVKLILLIGGTCKMPRIRDEVAKLFDRQTFANKDFNPLTAVAKGAAYLSFLAQETAIGHEVIYDIVPTPIGIEVKGGKFEILIKEGETLPTKGITKRYSTTKLNQTSAKFNIYKGFNEYVNSPEMEYITTLRIDGIPNGKAGEQSFEFTINVNKNGMMELSASVVGSDVKGDLIVSVDLSKKEEGEIAKLIKHFELF